MKRTALLLGALVMSGGCAESPLPAEPSGNLGIVFSQETTPSVTSISTNPSPPLQYQPFTLTINGFNFDTASVQVQLSGSSSSSCPPPNGCAANSFTSKSSTQLVVYPVSLSILGTYGVRVRNGSGGTLSSGAPTFTITAW